MTDREKALKLVESIIVRAEDERTNRSWESDDVGWKNVDKIWVYSQQLKELLKEQEAVEPYVDFDGHDVWRCGKCGTTIFHVYHNASDEDAKNYAKFCRHCGQAVKWEGSGNY